MRACGLPEDWRGRETWRILVTDFGCGHHFLALWQQWAQDPAAPGILHVAALAGILPEPAALHAVLRTYPALARHSDELTRHWFGWLPGFHRLSLHGGRLQLTLCIGPTQQMLRQLQFAADTVLLDIGAAAGRNAAPDSHWDHWGAKALARLCRRGTRVALTGARPSQPMTGALVQSGFTAPQPHTADSRTGIPSSDTAWRCEFQPRWQLNRTRTAWQQPPVAPGHCVVVGAGIAGAAVAEALARRGWQVTVLDAGPAPAAGASALPVGLLLPHVSHDDSARSQLSRAGARLTWQTVTRLCTAGTDFDDCGVAELAIDRVRRLPADWPPPGRAWSDNALPSPVAQALGTAGAPTEQALWHAQGGWIRPQRLVQALLAHPGIRWQGGRQVHHITCADRVWQLWTADGTPLARAPHLVLANAGDAPRLVESAAQAVPGITRLTPLTGLRGQVSWDLHRPADAAALPRFPVNGAGSVIAHVPQPAGSAWFAGATYENADGPPEGTAPAHAHNLAQMARLLPVGHATLAGSFKAGSVQCWEGTRWATGDRLPLAGRLHAGAQPGLWVSTAMGSRGLTFAVLCAELIAAHLGGEPAPLPSRLARLIAADRAR
jgi:tRNA 5-methylaminomethyl-2-thiouridine biosynthesis bifunctional protein